MSPGRVPVVDGDEARSTPWRPNVPLLVAGGVSIVVGGLAAAVTGPTGWEDGSWVAAFLVLVAGVAQLGVGAGQALLAATPVSRRFAIVECASWNAGCVLVLAGTLWSSPVGVSIGGVVLVVAVALATFAVRVSPRRSRLALAYCTLLGVVLVSIPVGIALSWARH